MMALPIQCLQSSSQSSDKLNEWFLLGASGPWLVVQSSSGAGSVWPTREETTNVGEPQEVDEERPGKRIKLSSPDNGKLANFSCLTLSHDKRHVVAVTGEDKCIRVFKIDSQYRLCQLSQRCMARRPSSITLTSDDSLILCADKFGDVYSLPLHPSPKESVETSEAASVEAVAPSEEYKPAASILTVHSGRNRKVLEEQLKQANKAPKHPKEPLKFQHQHELLLGHVSMLTDIAYANLDGRTYIITSDRDEHIRISRGPPQAHIIEGFCFGHEEFVNSLCITSSGRLVSGGGDPDLFVWDWVNYNLLNKISIRDAALKYLRSEPKLCVSLPDDEETFRVAVSGIWNIPISQREVNKVLVACEGIPALFQFDVNDLGSHEHTISLRGNPLAVTMLPLNQESCITIVAVDNIHEPGSTIKLRDNEDAPALQSYLSQGGQWSVDKRHEATLNSFAHRLAEPRTEADKKSLGGILYGVENLRKRPGAGVDVE